MIAQANLLADGVQTPIRSDQHTWLFALAQILHLANAGFNFTKVTCVFSALARFFALGLSATKSQKAKNDNHGNDCWKKAI